jgi:hypothetical protein
VPEVLNSEALALLAILESCADLTEMKLLGVSLAGPLADENAQ